MKYRQRLFIYDRREMGVLIVLTFMVSAFTFTLGVHFGKRVGPHGLVSETKDTSLVATVPDQIPNPQELTEQARGIEQTLEETLNSQLHEEVMHTGIKLNTSRQVDLPSQAKNTNAGATTIHSAADRHPSSKPVVVSSSETQKFVLQIGSYPTLEEAKKQLMTLNQPELKPFLREADIKGKGKWYRLYAGEFVSRSAAEQAGEQFRSRHMIASFIVSKLAD